MWFNNRVRIACDLIIKFGVRIACDLIMKFR